VEAELLMQMIAEKSQRNTPTRNQLKKFNWGDSDSESPSDEGESEMESEHDKNERGTGGPRKSVPVLPNEFLEFDSEGEEERVAPSPNDAEWTPPAK
jgi:hypothetical protein